MTRFSLFVNGTADEAFFRDWRNPKYGAELLQQSYKASMDLCKEVWVADNLRQVSGPNLTWSTKLPIRVHGTSSKKRRDRGVLSVTRPIGGVVLCITTLFFLLLKLLCGSVDRSCNSIKGAPNYGTGTEGSARIFARQSHERVAASFAAGHGIRESKYVGDCVTRIGVTKTQWAGGKSARQKLTAEGSDGGSSKKRIIRRVWRSSKG